MYERFSDRARKIMQLANAEAQRLHHGYIGTEHILLSLVNEGTGCAANVLMNLGCQLPAIREELERKMKGGYDVNLMNGQSQTPPAKSVVEYAMEEARGLGHNYVGSEHLLLGLLRQHEGLAAQVLSKFNMQLEPARREVRLLLGQSTESDFPSIPNSAFAAFADPPVPRHVFENPANDALKYLPKISSPSTMPPSLIAVDVGNSNIKLGHFAHIENATGVVGFKPRPGPPTVPTPTATFELPIVHATGMFDFQQLANWCGQHASPNTHWSIGSVHRSGGALLADTITAWATHLDLDWPIRRLVYQDLPLEVRVEQPGRVGIDRLLAAVAANQLRDPGRAAIVVDLGTAITVDLIEPDGAFAGGAILPGIGTAGRALADQTDALPHVMLDHSTKPPLPLGESTQTAIEAGLYWGTVGAV
ncbi:MAG TPA: type III pantothenate kinase, partial [Lacipirellulaceae bacterium]|nr:type III pantothenate kinase [Lacipirellulaceae bacterium]